MPLGFYHLLSVRVPTLIVFGSFSSRPKVQSIIPATPPVRPSTPFECVTTFDETIASLHLCVARCEREGKPLPLVLRHARESILSPDAQAASIASRLLSNDDTRHRIPAEFEKLLLAAVRE